MGSKYFKKKRTNKNLLKANKVISISSQLERLMNSFPNLQIEKSSDKEFIVIVKLRPHIFSKEYDVKIVYELGNQVSVFIVNEKLKIAKNRTKLPHVWDNELQKICLYSKQEGGSWSSEKSIASTIVPWASEWLYYYEIWLIDGLWYGGGHDEYINENELKNE